MIRVILEQSDVLALRETTGTDGKRYFNLPYQTGAIVVLTLPDGTVAEVPAGFRGGRLVFGRDYQPKVRAQGPTISTADLSAWQGATIRKPQGK